MRRQKKATTSGQILGIAAVAGLIAGSASVALGPQGAEPTVAKVESVGVALGITRQRSPQPGDSWRGCNEARAAGTAPIYAGEPGYSPDMDGDGDGIACEPHP